MGNSRKYDRLVKREGFWLLVAEKSGQILERFGKTKPSPARVAQAERRVQFFKRQNKDAVETVSPVQQAIISKQRFKNRKLRIKKQGRQRGTRRIEAQYQRRLRSIFSKMLEVMKENFIDRIPEIMNKAKTERLQLDHQRLDQSVVEELKGVLRATRAAIDVVAGEREIEAISQEFAEMTNDNSRENLARAFKQSVGIDIFSEGGFLADQISVFTANNVNLIQNVQNEFISQVENIMFDGIQRGERASVIRQRILAKVTDKDGFKGRFKKAVNRANLIARDQVNKLSGALNQERQEKVGIKKYVWRDSRDGRVRDSHKLDGALFEWGKSEGVFIEGPKKGQKAKKPRQGLNPGEDFQCRCFAEPYLDDLVE